MGIVDENLLLFTISQKSDVYESICEVNKNVK